ncbi:MAG: tRNA (guanosine(37)-N1)-methyltransferase TrmD, partial [Candidatus Portnoybacteria bacterium]
MIKFDIITIFPDIFDAYFNESILGRAQKKKLVKISIHDLRDYAADRHKTADDKPYGGG